MALLQEFKEFAVKGNVVDMAVGVIVGAAFGKIVSSLVGDVIMPPIGVLLGGMDFSSLAAQIYQAADGKPVVIAYGKFIQSIVDFTIVAFVIFLAIKGINRLKRRAPTDADVPPSPPTKEQELLTEIRDLLKARN